MQMTSSVVEIHKLLEGLTMVSCKFCEERLSAGAVLTHGCFTSRISPTLVDLLKSSQVGDM